VKTSELEGAQLALWVARALNLQPIPGQPQGFFYWTDQDGNPASGQFAPQEDWAQGGPIIERERIVISPCSAGWRAVTDAYLDDLAGDIVRTGKSCMEDGPTPLIAAMRAYVASVYGWTVPDEVTA
jgi:hypothetical protein